MLLSHQLMCAMCERAWIFEEALTSQLPIFAHLSLKLHLVLFDKALLVFFAIEVLLWLFHSSQFLIHFTTFFERGLCWRFLLVWLFTRSIVTWRGCLMSNFLRTAFGSWVVTNRLGLTSGRVICAIICRFFVVTVWSKEDKLALNKSWLWIVGWLKIFFFFFQGALSWGWGSWCLI